MCAGQALGHSCPILEDSYFWNPSDIPGTVDQFEVFKLFERHWTDKRVGAGYLIVH